MNELNLETVVYRYTFFTDICVESVEVALLLAIWGTESLHGEAASRLDAAYLFDRERAVLVIDGGTVVGETFNRIVCGFLQRELRPDAFQVRRLRNSGKQAARGHGEENNLSLQQGRCSRWRRL